MIEPIDTHERRVTHTETIKVVNNRYSTPVTLKFAATTTSPQIIVYHHPKDFSCNQAYQDSFAVIVDKNTHPKPHIYVKHVIESNLQINQMKFGQRNIMNTLHQQQAFLKFNKYYTHREACIGWFNYISTSITLQSSV